MRNDGVALIVDYGHARQGLGETLQAVAGHSFADPLQAPGEADLTAHVDFATLAISAEIIGARSHGPVSQRDFLKRLGIDKRAAALKAAGREKSAEIDAALARLTGTGRKRAWATCSRCSPSPIRKSDCCRACPDLQERLMITAATLALSGIRHGFFTRQGGVSAGVYASLNGGLGSNDAAANVAENRARMAASLGVEPDRLLTAFQIHSPDVLIAETPWPRMPGRAPTPSSPARRASPSA